MQKKESSHFMIFSELRDQTKKTPLLRE